MLLGPDISLGDRHTTTPNTTTNQTGHIGPDALGMAHICMDATRQAEQQSAHPQPSARVTRALPLVHW